MTAATAAAQITNHDEFIAFYSAPHNISAFAASVIGPAEIAEAASGDFYAQLYVAGQNQDLTRLEALTDAELEAEKAATEAIDGWNAFEGKWEVNEIGHRDHWLGVIAVLQELRAQRAAEAAWLAAPAEEHLSHHPFAALALTS